METLYNCKKKYKVDSEKEEDLLKVVFLSERFKKPSRKEKDLSEKAAALKRSALNGFYCHRILLCSSC